LQGGALSGTIAGIQRRGAAFAGSSGVPLSRFSRIDWWIVAAMLVASAGVWAVCLTRILDGVETLRIARGWPVGGDFAVFWTAGRMALDGAAGELHLVDAFHARQTALVGFELAPGPWLYPPPFLLVLAPFAAAPYLVAYLIWLLATAGLYLAAFAALERHALTTAALVLSPAAALNVLYGQNGFLNVGLLMLGLAMVGRRPILAGALIGVLVTKPHLALPALIVLAVRRSGAAIAALGAASAGLALLAALFFGWRLWAIYLTEIVPLQRAWVETAVGLHFHGVTAFNAVQSLGGGIRAAYALQAAFSGIALWGLIRVARSHADIGLRAAVALASLPVVIPYFFVYELTAPSAAAAIVVARARRDGFRVGERALIGLVWLAPAFALVVNRAGLPVIPVILLMFFLTLVQRAAPIRRSAA
jgi:hypothetical protein